MKEPSWVALSDEELLKWRIKDLALDLTKSDVYPWVLIALDELRDHEILDGVRVYLGDEWFSPEGVPAVAIPFFLTHARLRQLEKNMMMECEGETEKSFLDYLRHELGHAFDHAYRTSRRKEWMQLFGDPKKEYKPDTYRPRPYSKSFVDNIGNWYAQSHPDEDFAETFAVWLNPDSKWREKYKGWGALEKIQYVDKLAKEFQRKKIRVTHGRLMSDAAHLQSTLKNYYTKKRRLSREDYPDFYDDDLFHIFTQRTKELRGAEKAWRFMKRNRKQLEDSLAHWTSEKKATIHDLYNQLSDRCRELDLCVYKPETETALELASFLATIISNYLFTGHFKRTV